jgi:hypothetical protein
LKGIDDLEFADVDKRTILKLTLKELDDDVDFIMQHRTESDGRVL